MNVILRSLSVNYGSVSIWKQVMEIYSRTGFTDEMRMTLFAQL